MYKSKSVKNMEKSIRNALALGPAYGMNFQHYYFNDSRKGIPQPRKVVNASTRNK